MSATQTARRWVFGAAAVLAVLAALRLAVPAESVPGRMLGAVLDVGYAGSVLRLTVPIAFAALGGIFAERAGIINIGIEGFLIVSALTSVIVARRLPWAGVTGPTALWLAFVAGVLVSVLVAGVFAVLTVRYRSNQVIAGLAVWLVALGLAPFITLTLFDSSSPTIGTLGTWPIPLLSQVPVVGPVLFDASPVVYMMLVATPLAWYALRYTRLGRRIRAAGENPKALDTAGVSVSRVRYAGVLISGVLAGIGGAGFTVGQLGTFVAVGQTSIGGRGFLGIVAYLFGNYNPFAAVGGAMLFAGFDSLQLRLQQIGALDVPSELFGILPFVVVLVTITLVRRTRVPSALGEPYDGEE
jgi:simple sugar transport system permease protein